MDVVPVALKAVGIVVVEEVVEAPIVVDVVAPHQSTEMRFPEESALFIGPTVPATVHSTAGSSMKSNPRGSEIPW